MRDRMGKILHEWVLDPEVVHKQSVIRLNAKHNGQPRTEETFTRMEREYALNDALRQLANYNIKLRR